MYNTDRGHQILKKRTILKFSYDLIQNYESIMKNLRGALDDMFSLSLNQITLNVKNKY